MSNEVSLKTKEKVAYGIGAIGKDWVYALVSGFLLIYFNTVIGVSGVFTGVLFMVARVFDAFNDPFMGVIVEKTRTKMGKFRPWLLIGTLLNAVVLYAMFAVPEGLTTGQTKVYISVAYILWGMTYTIMDIPYWSMIPAITKSGKDRENISVIARSCAGVGAAIATALTALLIGVFGGGNERLGYKLYAGMVAVFFVVTILITVFNVREKVVDNKKAVSVKEMLLSLIHNDQAMVVVIGIIVFNASLYLTQSLATYFFKYEIPSDFLGNGLIGALGLTTIYFIVTGMPSFIGMLFADQMKKWLGGYRNVLIFIQIFNIVARTIAFFVGFEGKKLWISMIIIGIGSIPSGASSIAQTSIFCDSIDYMEWKTGKRTEGITFSMQTSFTKISSGITSGLATLALHLLGYRAIDNAEVYLGTQTAAFDSWIWPLTVLTPAIASVLFIVPLLFVDYTKEKRALVESDLNARRNSLKESGKSPYVNQEKS